MKPLRFFFLTAALFLLLTASASARQAKLIALTFDDGPSRACTPQILDTLEAKHAKATFFLVGEWLPGHEDIVKRELADGDQIGNHTFAHKRLTALSDQEIQDSIAQTNRRLTDITGLKHFMVRPPYGARDPRVAAQIDAPIILWSVDAASGKALSAQQLVNNIMAKAGDGGIILLHDTTQANADAVGPVIDRLHAQGYQFVTVQELFRRRGLAPCGHVMYKRIVSARVQLLDDLSLLLHGIWARVKLDLHKFLHRIIIKMLCI